MNPDELPVSIFLTNSFLVLKGCYQVSLELSLLQVEQFQLSQPFHAEEVLQASDNFGVPLLDMLQ